jgi:DNA-binding NarL/FixJ family response regulator
MPDPRRGEPAVTALPLGDGSSGPDAVRSEQLTSVLICDDRPNIRRALARQVGQPEFCCPPVEIVAVTDGFALLAALEATPAAAVLIAIHAGSTVGDEAITMLQGRHPAVAPIIVGSVVDIDLLTQAYARGAGGLMLWEPGQSDASGLPSAG